MHQLVSQSALHAPISQSISLFVPGSTWLIKPRGGGALCCHSTYQDTMLHGADPTKAVPRKPGLELVDTLGAQGGVLSLPGGANCPSCLVARHTTHLTHCTQHTMDTPYHTQV